MNAQQYLEHWKQGEERGESPPSETPRTDAAALSKQSGALYDEACKMELELNASQAAIVDAIGNILSRGGDEEWPIIKHLRAALKI